MHGELTVRRKLADEKRKIEEAQQLKAGEVEKVVETRLRAVKGDLDKTLASATSERDALNARLTAIQIDQAVVIHWSTRSTRAAGCANCPPKEAGARWATFSSRNWIDGKAGGSRISG